MEGKKVAGEGEEQQPSPRSERARHAEVELSSIPGGAADDSHAGEVGEELPRKPQQNGEPSTGHAGHGGIDRDRGEQQAGGGGSDNQTSKQAPARHHNNQPVGDVEEPQRIRLPFPGVYAALRTGASHPYNDPHIHPHHHHHEAVHADPEEADVRFVDSGQGETPGAMVDRMWSNTIGGTGPHQPNQQVRHPMGFGEAEQEGLDMLSVVGGVDSLEEQDSARAHQQGDTQAGPATDREGVDAATLSEDTAGRKVLQCGYPGCSKSFTRPCALVSHQKSHKRGKRSLTDMLVEHEMPKKKIKANGYSDEMQQVQGHESWPQSQRFQKYNKREFEPRKLRCCRFQVGWWSKTSNDPSVTQNKAHEDEAVAESLKSIPAGPSSSPQENAQDDDVEVSCTFSYKRLSLTWSVTEEGKVRKLLVPFASIARIDVALSESHLSVLSMTLSESPKFLTGNGNTCRDFTDGAAVSNMKHTGTFLSSDLDETLCLVLEKEPRLRSLTTIHPNPVSLGFQSISSAYETLQQERKKARTRLADVQESMMCVVCQSAVRCVVTMPCGHLLLCFHCYRNKSSNCLVCQTPIYSPAMIQLPTLDKKSLKKPKIVREAPQAAIASFPPNLPTADATAPKENRNVALDDMTRQIRNRDAQLCKIVPVAEGQPLQQAKG